MPARPALPGWCSYRPRISSRQCAPQQWTIPEGLGQNAGNCFRGAPWVCKSQAAPGWAVTPAVPAGRRRWDPGAAVSSLPRGCVREPAPGLLEEEGRFPPVPAASFLTGLGLSKSQSLRFSPLIQYTKGLHSSRVRSRECPAQTFGAVGPRELQHHHHP